MRPIPRTGPLNRSLAAADWKKNLTIGPNGPIPAIVVDQFGYPAEIQEGCRHTRSADRLRQFRQIYARQIVRVDRASDRQGHQDGAPPTVWNGGNTDPASGDKAWWFDFSEIETPGKYAVVDLEKGDSIGQLLDRRSRLQRCHEACAARIFLSARGIREETGVRRQGLGGQGKPPRSRAGFRVAPVARGAAVEPG